MADLSIALTFLLLQVVLSEEAFRQSISDDVFTFGNFYHHEEYKLLAANLKEERVKSFVECLVQCVQTQKCVSTNINTTRDYDEMYVCELLAFDKYQNQPDFKPSKGFDHYSIASPCEKKPCQHQGKCSPVYTNNTYTCACLPGTLGRDCQITDFRSCAQRYAAGYRNSSVYEIKTPDKNKTEVYCNHDNGEGWTMIFRTVSGVDLQQGPSALWISNSLLECSPSALPINSSSRQHYKSRIVEQWQAFNPRQVRLSLYKNRIEVLHLVFNATGSNKTNWFSRERVLKSPWSDLHSRPVNFFSVYGHKVSRTKRSFFINSHYGSCPNDFGWMLLVELVSNAPCPYENRVPEFSILYAPNKNRVKWETQDPQSVADMMVIYVR